MSVLCLQLIALPPSGCKDADLKWVNCETDQFYTCLEQNVYVFNKCLCVCLYLC